MDDGRWEVGVAHLDIYILGARKRKETQILENLFFNSLNI